MSKRRKFMIICGVIIFAGLVLSGAGISMGGRVTSVALNSQGLKVNTPQKTRNGGSAYQKENTGLDAFTEMNIEAAYAGINIVRSDHYGIEYSISENSTISYDIKQGVLDVKQGYRSNGANSGFQFFLFQGFSGIFVNETKEEYINIYVPEGVEMGNAAIICDSGNTEMKGFSAKSLEIESEYGNLKLSDITADSIQLIMDSGNVKIEKLTADSLTAQLEYGNCDMQMVTVNGKTQLILDSGNAKLEDVTTDGFFIESAYGNVKGGNLITREAEMKLDSGNIELDTVTLDTLDIESEYGDVEIELSSPVSAYSFDLFTDYGGVEVNRENMGVRYNTMGNPAVEKWIKGYCDSGNIIIKEK